MGRYQCSLKGLHLLSLITILQALAVRSFPFRAPNHNANEPPDDGPLHPGLAIPYVSSSNVYDYVVTQKHNGHKSHACKRPAYVVGNGQVKAACMTSTKVISVTTSGSTIVSSSIVTEYYTPVPRQDTTSFTSTSTTTVFVVPTPTRSGAISGSATSTPLPPTTSAPPKPAQSITLPDNSLTSLTTSEVQTLTQAPITNTGGMVQTTLETSGAPSANPFLSQSLKTSGTLSLVDTATLSSLGPTATANVTDLLANNIFRPIATDAPPQQIQSRSDHPVPRLGIQQQQDRLETNKFYANFFLGDQTSPTWTHPYSLSWSKGSGQTDSWGIAVSHIERNQLATGPKQSKDAGEWSFFAAPIGIQSIVISAAELTTSTTLTTDMLQAFSVNVNLLTSGEATPTITFPLLQGMGFVTAKYNSGTPLIQSGVGIQNVTYAGGVINGGSTFKYKVLLTDGFTWLVYVTPLNAGYDENSFTLIGPGMVQGPSGFGGYIQIAKIPADIMDAESVYDGSAGVYAIACSVSGAVDGTQGTYKLSWTKQGAVSQSLLMFALPHHVDSVAYNTRTGATDVQLVTTSKGLATAIKGDSWTLVEPDLPIAMGFNPWSPTLGDASTLSATAIGAINAAGAVELVQNISKQTNTGSTYYDGKALAKFAAIVYVLHELADNATLAFTGLMELEDAFDFHINNQQTFPLVYDTAWGGVVSVATYFDGNSGDDFGNTYYNDHHFHYGYFLYAAAVIGYLDPSWLNQDTNKAWVNTLARDFANSVSDSYFPFSRSFDWYMGHSWAKGLFQSADGKDEESSSEDTMASFGIKMWGKIVGDKNMEARGNLMLSIQARSLQHYFLYTSDNTVEPPEFIGNKVSGVMFENKIDHTTYFGPFPEMIEGIHMLPLMPMSTLIRTPTFVQQEWDAYSFTTYASTLQSGWRGILMANLAIVDPVTSYNFFSNANGDFNFGMLDSGASQTWYLAWSAALGGSP